MSCPLRRVSLTRWLGLLWWLRRSWGGFGATRPKPKPLSNERASRRWSGLKSRSLLMSLTLLTLSYSGCTKSPPLASAPPDRPCYQWVITRDQEVYVYDNGHLVARLETQPYDAVISGWCVMRNNEHLMNDIRALSR